MEQNILIDKALKIHPVDGFDGFTQHSVGTKYLAAKLDVWSLIDGECLFIAFEKQEDGGNKIDPIIMNRTFDGGLYYTIIPNEVIHDNGGWAVCVYKKFGWNEETGEAEYCEAGEKFSFEVFSTIRNDMLNILAIVFLFLGAFFILDVFQKYAETFLWIEFSAAVGSVVSCVLWGRHKKYARYSESIKATIASEAFERREGSK